MTSQLLQQRGCRECGALKWHNIGCSMYRKPGEPLKGVLDHERSVEPKPEVPPDTIWVEFRPMLPSDLVGIMSYYSDPREIHDNGKPVYQYRRVETCLWVYDDIDDKWDSTCGESWQLTTGGPEENRMKHCHGCGGTLEVGSDG